MCSTEQQWNPVKELKDTFLDFLAKLIDGVWNPVKELKDIGFKVVLDELPCLHCGIR